MRNLFCFPAFGSAHERWMPASTEMRLARVFQLHLHVCASSQMAWRHDRHSRAAGRATCSRWTRDLAPNGSSCPARLLLVKGALPRRARRPGPQLRSGTAATTSRTVPAVEARQRARPGNQEEGDALMKRLRNHVAPSAPPQTNSGPRPGQPAAMRGAKRSDDRGGDEVRGLRLVPQKDKKRKKKKKNHE